MPVMAAYAYKAKHHRSKEKLCVRLPRKGHSTAETFLAICREDGKYTALEASLLDLCLILHAEHGGGNNSAFTTHVVTSSLTDTYSAITAALGSLKGPRHGGANIKVAQMFEDMKASVKNWDNEREVEDYLAKLVKKEAFDRTGLIYGIGHAVYSTSDPRSLILRDHVVKLAAEKGVSDEMNLYLMVERIGPGIIEQNRKMYKGVSANVDFYSGMLYKLLDIPSELFTPLFAISRIVGFSAHRIEELANNGKIIRPAYKSVAPRRHYTPIENRG
jgi:citrate synthase